MDEDGQYGKCERAGAELGIVVKDCVLASLKNMLAWSKVRMQRRRQAQRQ